MAAPRMAVRILAALNVLLDNIKNLIFAYVSMRFILSLSLVNDVK